MMQNAALQQMFDYYIQTVQQGYSTSVLEGRCPGELSYSPNQTHMGNFQEILHSKLILNWYDWLSSTNQKIKCFFKNDGPQSILVTIVFHYVDTIILCST